MFILLYSPFQNKTEIREALIIMDNPHFRGTKNNKWINQLDSIIEWIRCGDPNFCANQGQKCRMLLPPLRAFWRVKVIAFSWRKWKCVEKVLQRPLKACGPLKEVVVGVRCNSAHTPLRSCVALRHLPPLPPWVCPCLFKHCVSSVCLQLISSVCLCFLILSKLLFLFCSFQANLAH